MKKTILAGCVIAIFLASGFTFGQPEQATTQTHPLFPLNIGDKWTYRNVDLKKAAYKTEPPKETVVVVERQEIFKQTENNKVTQHVGFILKSKSGDKTASDFYVILKDGIRAVHRTGTQITPPLN